MPGDWTRYLKNQPWYETSNLAENYPKAVEQLLRPREFRREFFRRMVARAPMPGPGYRSLANLCRRGLVHTILTTNFDTLVEDALRAEVPHIKEVIAINRAEGDLVQFSPHRRAQVVYLHGAVETYRDQNSEEETKRLHAPLVTKIHEMIQYAPLVVLGYRGAEPSIMEHLLTEGITASNNYNHGVFWCTRPGASVHRNVLALQERIGANFELVTVDGFDEAMEAIDHGLSDKAAFQAVLDLPESSLPSVALSSFDSHPLADQSLNEIDKDLAFTTFHTYAKEILGAELQMSSFESFLREHGFLAQTEGGRWVPTYGLFVLFGLDMTDTYPHLQTVVRIGEKKRLVFKGNLLTQYRDVMEVLTSSEINPLLRIKKAQQSVEKTAYHNRALTELLVNMMAHRDYENTSLSEIAYEPGTSLMFKTAGGLPEGVLTRLQPDRDGTFQPRRGVHQVRNPIVADVFFALGRMDKQGTGLVDVRKRMQEHEGTAEFRTADSNSRVEVTLFQARAERHGPGQTASPVAERELYISNLLPFLSVPANVYKLPLNADCLDRKRPLFVGSESDDPEPTAIATSGYAMSFNDLARFPVWANRVGYLDYLETTSFEKMADDPDTRRQLVWLLGKYWERYLRTIEPSLVIEPKKKRAHFGAAGTEELVVTYDSPLRRNIKRTVVKKREVGKYPEFEIEALSYAIVQYGSQWTVQIKPTYLFTKSDAKTPLPGYQQASRATRRFKFDRNPAVDSDLKFWQILLSGGKSAVRIGGDSVDDLILSGTLASIEAYEA